MADMFDKVAPHAVVRNWLGKETVERLLQFSQSNEHFFKDSLVYQSEMEGIFKTTRISRTLSSKALSVDIFEGELKAKVIDLLPVVFDRLGIKRFVPNRIQTDFVAHGDGAFFVRHIDTNLGGPTVVGDTRVISAIYYFYALPKAFSGGLLRLYSLNMEHHTDIPPDYDTIVFFPSFLPHEVLPVKCPSQQFVDSRFAVNFWINMCVNRN